MKIWMLNHYATEMFFDKAGRHYWFAQKLKDKGHETVVFSANTYLNSDDVIDTGKKKYCVKNDENTTFVFVKTPTWSGNGAARVKNWIAFYRNLFPTSREYSKEHGRPDIIIASSVHPLTMIAGIKIAKIMKIPCICEIRDLWPEAIFRFGKAKENSLIGQVLIKGEHWIYKKADALIFTKEGDTDYLKERKWTTSQGGDVDLSKCHYINNGVDIEGYEKNISESPLDDPDLADQHKFNVTYCGTIRPVNNVGNLLDTATLLKKEKGYEDVQFLIFGDGGQLQELKDRVRNEHLDSVKLKGFIERRYIPYILSRSSVNMLNYSQNQYNWSRGNSSNKLFEYMASGKPVISTVRMGYSIINRYSCGIELNEDTPEALAEQIKRFHDMSVEERDQIGQNAKNGARDFDFGVLTEKLLTVIKNVKGESEND